MLHFQQCMSAYQWRRFHRRYGSRSILELLQNEIRFNSFIHLFKLALSGAKPLPLLSFFLERMELHLTPYPHDSSFSTAFDNGLSQMNYSQRSKVQQQGEVSLQPRHESMGRVQLGGPDTCRFLCCFGFHGSIDACMKSWLFYHP